MTPEKFTIFIGVPESYRREGLNPPKILEELMKAKESEELVPFEFDDSGTHLVKVQYLEFRSAPESEEALRLDDPRVTTCMVILEKPLDADAEMHLRAE